MLTIRTCLLATSLILPTFVSQPLLADDSATLASVVAARSAEQKVRDSARHPIETLEFFQIEPGMTVAEGLPGGGWYTRILANYLGADGVLYGVNYPDRMWPMVYPGRTEWIEARIASSANFAAEVATYTDNGITARGFTFDTVPPEVEGTVDRVLMVRALHNLNRFEGEAKTMSEALASIRAMLKDDGMVGVVQHRTSESANGQRGYMNQAAVTLMFEEAGFELVDETEINANPIDRPTADENVWRLAPSLRGNEDNPVKQAEMAAIGESDRMTLLFRKAP